MVVLSLTTFDIGITKPFLIVSTFALMLLVRELPRVLKILGSLASLSSTSSYGAHGFAIVLVIGRVAP